jgi:hypothetical protein
LPASNCHARILAKEKRNCQKYFRCPFSTYHCRDLADGEVPIGFGSESRAQEPIWGVSLNLSQSRKVLELPHGFLLRWFTVALSLLLRRIEQMRYTCRRV